MSLDVPTAVVVDPTGLSFAIVAARFNARHVDRLLARCVETLRAAGVAEAAIRVARVPGSHEVPWAAQALAGEGVTVVVALGVLLKGATNHHELVAEVVAHALQRVALDTGVPVINGVMAVDDERQAEARCGPEIDRGAEFGRAALEMAELARALMAGRGGHGL